MLNLLCLVCGVGVWGYVVRPRRIGIASAWLLVWIGVVQHYFAEQDRLVLLREAYRSQHPPWQCEDEEWTNPADPVCVEYKVRINMGVWPNPIRVATDSAVAGVEALGQASAAFLKHQSLFVFIYGVCMVIFFVVAWPWLCWFKSLAPQPRLYHTRQRLMSIEEVEEDTKLLVC